MMREESDIAIIGAGAAGLAAAKAVTGERGLSVILIESRKAGSRHLSPLTFSDVVESHNLQGCVKGRYSTFGFHNYQGSVIRFCFETDRLVVVDYGKICSTLLCQIEKSGNNGFRYIEGKVVSVWPEHDKVAILLADGMKVEARILIDCSGWKQVAMGREIDHVNSWYSHVYGALLRTRSSIDDRTPFFLMPSDKFGSGGGWFYPLNDGFVSFGYATISSSPSGATADLEENFHNALRKFAPYSDYLADADLDHIETGTIPLTYVPRMTWGPVVVAGDAAGMATPWTCMGIEAALTYGALAGSMSVGSLCENDPKVLSRFGEEWSQANKEACDLFSAGASQFWNGDHYFWEWIIKNDLSYLSPERLVERLRRNRFVMSKASVLVRALRFKLRSLVNRRFLQPVNLTIEQR